MSEETKGKPAFIAYQVQDYKDAEGNDKSNWNRVGVAFSHKSGEGINVILDSVPLSGRIVLMPPKED